MGLAFIIGNGESRRNYDITKLKGRGIIYGCNAIYRDHPTLCDRIVAVNQPMYEEVAKFKNWKNMRFELLGPKQVSRWNYKFRGERMKWKPGNLKYFRVYQRGKKSSDKYRFKDFTLTKGSGCSAVLHAAEKGYNKIVILGFDMLGKIDVKRKDFEPWQNNMYKNTNNYPERKKMKSYLTYEWLYHMTQILRKYPETDFYLFNDPYNFKYNTLYQDYFAVAPNNVRCGSYEDLDTFLQGEENSINWIYYK